MDAFITWLSFEAVSSKMTPLILGRWLTPTLRPGYPFICRLACSVRWRGYMLYHCSDLVYLISLLATLHPHWQLVVIWPGAPGPHHHNTLLTSRQIWNIFQIKYTQQLHSCNTRTLGPICIIITGWENVSLTFSLLPGWKFPRYFKEVWSPLWRCVLFLFSLWFQSLFGRGL